MSGLNAIISLLTAVIGVAIIAALVSQRANTANVISAGAGGFSNILATALSPITGSSANSSVNNSVNAFTQ